MSGTSAFADAGREPASDIVSIFTEARQNPVELELNKSVERTMSGGGKHAYAVSMQAGEFARVIVDQLGIDVLVKLYTPDGVLVTSIDNPNGSSGAEPVQIVADTAGLYRIEVASFEDNAVAGRYEVKLVERRTATDRDRDWASARRIFDAAEKLFAEGTQESLAAAALKYQQARSQFQTLGDRNEEFTIQIGLGLAYREAGRLTEAVAAFSAGLPIAVELGDKFRQARIFELNASAHGSMGELEKALQERFEAVKLYQAVGDRLNEAQALYQLGGQHNVLGEHEQARAFYEKALLAYRPLDVKSIEGLILRSIGDSYHLEDNRQKSTEYYKKALASLRAFGSKREIAITLSMLSNDYAAAGERKEALDAIDEALRIVKEVPSGTAGLTANIGVTYLKLGEPDRALDYFEAPLRRYQQLGHKRQEAVMYRHIAVALRDLGRLSEARDAIEKSIVMLEFIRDRAGTPEQQASFVSTLFHFYELYVDIRMRMHDAAPTAGEDLAALELVERVKVRSLVELITSAKVDLRQGVDPRLLEREKLANERITGKLDELARASERNAAPEERNTLERDLAALQEEFRVVQSEIREQSPHYAGFAAPPPLSVKDIQQQILDDNTVLLEYSLGDDRSYLWAVTKSGFKSYKLPPRSVLEKQARRVYELVTTRSSPAAGRSKPSYRGAASSDQAYWEEAQKLSDVLLGPAVADLGVEKRLLIVADGALQYLPFSALPAPAAAAKSARRPLLIDHEIVNLPSASVLAVMRKEYSARQAAPKLAAVLADPVYDADDSRVQARPEIARSGAPRSRGDKLNFRRLLFSRSEADAILSETPALSSFKSLDFDSNRQLAMSAELSKYRIIHFSTHGLVDSRRPEFSGLVLSQVNRSGEPQDGFLRLHEIYNLRLNAELVVLSACQTGLGKIVRGEGLVGLTRGFMYAGSPRVVASLWQVDDAATSELMKWFYRGLLKGNLSVAAALRSAQLEMMRKKPWQSPYYWGAFVLQGEWK